MRLTAYAPYTCTTVTQIATIVFLHVHCHSTSTTNSNGLEVGLRQINKQQKARVSQNCESGRLEWHHSIRAASKREVVGVVTLGITCLEIKDSW